MSDAEIEQAMRDAQQYTGQDNLRKEALELSGDAQKLLGETQRALKAGGKQSILISAGTTCSSTNKWRFEPAH